MALHEEALFVDSDARQIVHSRNAPFLTAKSESAPIDCFQRAELALVHSGEGEFYYAIKLTFSGSRQFIIPLSPNEEQLARLKFVNSGLAYFDLLRETAAATCELFSLDWQRLIDEFITRSSTSRKEMAIILMTRDQISWGEAWNRAPAEMARYRDHSAEHEE